MTCDRPLISVVIPAINESGALPALFDRLTAVGVDQIIVADGGSCDNTVEITRSGGAELVVAALGRGTQIAAGAALARGDVLWIVHADCVPPPASRAIIHEIMSDPRTALGCFPLRFDRRRFWLEVYEAASHFDSVLTTFGDQGYFMRRADFLESGGAPDWPLFEDVEIRRRLRKIGRVKKARRPIFVSSRRFDENGDVSQEFSNACLLLRFLLGASPHQLVRAYAIAGGKALQGPPGEARSTPPQ